MKNVFTIIALAGLLFSACKRELNPAPIPGSTNSAAVISEQMMLEDGNNPDEAGIADDGSAERRAASGHVYVESNDAVQNSILIFRQQHNGKLELKSKVPSGGKGLGAGLASQGALALDRKHNLLFAVNAGSNSVSSFSVKNNGDLELRDTELTHGEKPVSVTVHDNVIYVLNNSSADIQGFFVSEKGKLTPIEGSHQALSGAGADPAQIAFTPDGNALLISEKATNKITAFRVKKDGVASDKVVNESVGTTPFGFDFVRNDFMIVSNADGGTPATSSCTSYKNIDNLFVKAVNGKVNNGQTAVCWVGTTSFGRYAFAANTGSNTISAFYVDFHGKLYLIPWVNEPSGEKPADIIVSSDNEFVYNINGGNNTLGEYRRGVLGKLHSIGNVESLPDFAAGLVSK